MPCLSQFSSEPCGFLLKSAVIKELESRVHQLSVEADGINKIRTQLERRKEELEGQVECLQAELAESASKYVRNYMMPDI